MMDTKVKLETIERWAFWIVMCIFFIIGTSMLTGCGTQRKIEKAKAVAYQHPQDFMEFCSIFAPVKEKIVKGKPDTVVKNNIVTRIDSLLCPEGKDGKITYVKVPVEREIVKYINQTDTVFQENTARVNDLSNKLNKANQDLFISERNIKEAQQKSKTMLWWIIGLGVALVGGIAFRLKGLFI